MEGNGPECHTHHIIKRYVKKLRLMVIFCSNVPGGKVAVSQKRPSPARQTGSRAVVYLANGCFNRHWELSDGILRQK